jgi:hypothetical protein
MVVLPGEVFLDGKENWDGDALFKIGKANAQQPGSILRKNLSNDQGNLGFLFGRGHLS